MQKIIVPAIFSSLLMFTSSSYAESTLPLNDDIRGAWVLKYTKKSEKVDDLFPREDIWVFNDNKVTIKHIPRNGSYYDQLPVSYEMKDGELKVGILGRAGKFDKFSLLNKDEKNMTLKTRYGDIYQFIKK